jgi:L-ascorbate metabolism protein UlaG (beta-lactamase superfamily)
VPEPLSLTFHGHACFELADGDTSVLIDPFLAPYNPAATTTAAELSPQHVVVTHGHVDHVASAVEVAKNGDATVYALVEIADWFNKQAITAIDINLGGRVEFARGTIGFVPAFHTNTLPDGTVVGQAAGAVIRMNSHCVYHVGDSALFSDMALIGEMEQVDTMIVPIGGRYTMDIVAAVRATEFVKPKRVIPCHYNTFPAIEVDAQDFMDRVQRIGGIEVQLLSPGDKIALTAA